MALIYCDSFDTNTDPAARWVGSGTGISITTGGRNGNALLLANASLSRTMNRPVTLVTPSEPIVGLAYYTADIQSKVIFQLREAGTVHVDVRLDPTGKLYVTRAATVLGTVGSTILTAGTWYYLELKVKIHDTLGTYELRINGNTVAEVSGSGVDTRNGATGIMDNLLVSDPGASGSRFDDLYIADTSGSAPNNDFLGDCRIEALFPNGNGNSSQLVGSDGNSTDNYLLVDEASANGDTDYVQSATVNDKDTYAMTNLTPTAGTVYGVQPVPYARKSDAGLRKIVSVARLSGTEVDSADKVLSQTYDYYPDMRETKPGGGAWTVSDVNSAEFGVKVTA